MKERKYKNFIDECDKNNICLGDAIKNEIKNVIENNTTEDATKLIMDLIIETRYEW